MVDARTRKGYRFRGAGGDKVAYDHMRQRCSCPVSGIRGTATPVPFYGGVVLLEYMYAT